MSEHWEPGMDGGFAVSSRELSSGVLLAPRGDVDLATVAVLDGALQSAEASYELVLLDLRQVPFMDSSGLHTLISSDLRMRECGGRLVIVPGGDQIRRLLELTGADKQLELVDDPDEVLVDPSNSRAPAP